MNLCLVSGIFPPDIGGPATYVHRLATSFHDAGWRVEVLTYSDRVTEESEHPFAVRRISRRSPARKIQTYLITRRLARHADLVSINGLYEMASLAARSRRVPSVIKIVGDPAWERARNLSLTELSFDAFQTAALHGRMARWRRLLNAALSRADAIVVPSEFLRGVVARWGFGGKARVIPNGVDLAFGQHVSDEAVAALRRRLGIEGPTVIMAGRLTPWKGHCAVLRALGERLPKVLCVIVGDGPFREAIASASEACGVQQRVRFVGDVPHGDFATYLKAADALVLNSGYEGFPHVVLEAMAVGCPVAASRAGGTPELVRDGDNGLLFAQDDTGAIAEAIRRLLDDGTLRTRLIEGGRRTAAHYSWERTFRETRELYEALVRPR